MRESLSFKDAQKLILLSQKLPPANQKGSALDATLASLEHMGYLQIDTISAIQRAHHHTLWNRNPRYQTDQLDMLVAEKKVFEYWSHAAAFLPMCDYRFSLPRKRAIASGEQNHWFRKNPELMAYVHDRISAEGPLMAKDFDKPGKKKGEWGAHPIKQALETLFMQGDLMISERRNFHKVYELTERVLPSTLNTTLPNDEENARFLITSYLRTNGLAQVSEITYLQNRHKTSVQKTVLEMESAGELKKLEVNNKTYFALPHFTELLKRPLKRSILKILSPFDNLLIQRKRMKDIFNYDYQIECYVPKEKRQFGYFSLPLLWDGKLVARMDCKAFRKERTLQINSLFTEPALKKVDAFSVALVKELKAFTQFNDCDSLRVESTVPAYLRDSVEKQYS